VEYLLIHSLLTTKNNGDIMSEYCELCHSHNLTHLLKKDVKSKHFLNIVSCEDCGLIAQKEIPSDEELKIYYSHNYRQDYKSTYSPKPKYVQRAGQAALDRIQYLEKHLNIRQQTLIDVGAGGGEFVYMAKQRGFLSSGIEPNVGYSSFSKEQYGVEVKTAMLADVEESSADVLTLFHVFEHMAKPDEVMKKLHRCLKENRHLFIEVPNILQADASPHNIYFKAHLFYYSRHTLISMASPYFEVVNVEDQGNLRVLFKKRTQVLESTTLPTAQAVQYAQQRLQKKGWFEYLVLAGGIFKPLLRIERIVAEAFISKKQPKQILDDLLADEKQTSYFIPRRQVKRAGAWSIASGLGLITYEVLF
jgi:2-polyprenyl-3-methyl-5-hydroxy-6-metoxy-1,4-benzoquinol methylase